MGLNGGNYGEGYSLSASFILARDTESYVHYSHLSTWPTDLSAGSLLPAGVLVGMSERTLPKA